MRLQRLLTSIYERFGSSGLVIVCALGGGLAAEGNTLIAVTVITRYLRGSVDEGVKLAAIASAVLLVSMAVGVAWSQRSIRVALAWTGDARGPSLAPELWRTLLRAPSVLVMRVVVVVLVLESIPVAVGMSDLHQPLYTAAPLALLAASMVAAIAVFVMFGLEIGLRPMMDDVAAHLPSGFEPDVPAWRLRTKVLAPIPLATLFAGMLVGAYANAVSGSALRLALCLGLAAGTAAAAVGVFLISTGSALDPIDRLTDATHRVRSGDLATPVPIVSADELGALAHSFNEMLEGLREREALRGHNAELVTELRASRARIVAAADEERRRVERDLHDGAQQHLVLLGLRLGTISRKLQGDPEAAAMTAELRSDLDRALGELRDLAHGIYPSLLGSDGLSAALQEAAQRAPIPTEVDLDGGGRYPPGLETAVYFCCLEALQNAAKHAGDGSRATVRLAERDRMLEFVVADDGAGFDPAAPNANKGLQNMADRIGALGGELTIDSAPGRGTRITGSIPLASQS